jgi:hypothetical protein
MQPFLALITPLLGSAGGQPPGTPPGYWGGGPHPMPPIYPGGGIDPGHPPSGPVDPGWSGGIGQEGTRPPIGSVDPGWGQTPGAHPSHPIYYPGGGPGFSPPGYWGGGPHPMPPIAPPPENTQPPGWGPIYIWGGGPGARPPIALPPDETLPPTNGEPERPVDWKAAWTPATGWIVVGIPSGAHPTPSK